MRGASVWTMQAAVAFRHTGLWGTLGSGTTSTPPTDLYDVVSGMCYV